MTTIGRGEGSGAAEADFIAGLHDTHPVLKHQCAADLQTLVAHIIEDGCPECGLEICLKGGDVYSNLARNIEQLRQGRERTIQHFAGVADTGIVSLANPVDNLALIMEQRYCLDEKAQGLRFEVQRP